MSKPKNLVPKLRFPEFREAGGWEAVKLKELTTLITKGTTPTSVGHQFIESGINFIKIESITAEGYVDLAKSAAISEECNEALKRSQLQENDILFSIAGALGVISVVRNDVLPANTNQALGIVRLKNKESLGFVSAFLKTQSIQSEILKIKAGAAQPNISLGQLSDFDILLPEINEQQKIADCLSSLDDLISAQTQKIGALKTHKKGLMQQLFPAEGETLPKRRFPEFREAGEWELIPIGEKINLFSGHPFDGSDISEDQSGIRLLRGINITEGEIRHNQDIDRYYLGNTDQLDRYKVVENDLVIAMDGSKVGKNVALVSKLDAGALLVQRVARLRATNPTIIKYIFQWVNSNRFQSYVHRINTSSGIPHISAKQINDFPVSFSSDEEQQKIADCLSSLDELITAHIQKLDALKNLKKGLMQQLFPTVDGGVA
jgi:type I restriction enzyme S subunit